MRYAIALALAVVATAHAQKVHEMPAPHDGYRPQAVVDADGVIHVVQGHSQRRTDLYYTKRKPGGQWSKPIRVNKREKIVAAFNISLGKNGRVHVLIRPNPVYLKLMMPEKKRLKFFDLKYMLYCRLNDEGTAFSEERDLSAEMLGFEGVGSVLADKKGTVYAFFHGQKIAKFGESTREVFRVVSTDEGKTFSKPEAVKTDVGGACQCCPMIGMIDDDGTIALAFRNAQKTGEHMVTKDSYLMVSKDGGKTFEGTFLEAWAKAGCPGSTFAMTRGPGGRYVAWRTMKKVKFAREAEKLAIVSPTLGAQTRTPALAINKDGVVFFGWGTRAKRKQPGHVVYELFKDGKSLGDKKVIKNGAHARWGSFAAVAQPDGSFLLLYDGPGAKAEKK